MLIKNVAYLCVVVDRRLSMTGQVKKCVASWHTRPPDARHLPRDLLPPHDSDTTLELPRWSFKLGLPRVELTAQVAFRSSSPLILLLPPCVPA